MAKGSAKQSLVLSQENSGWCITTEVSCIQFVIILVVKKSSLIVVSSPKQSDIYSNLGGNNLHCFIFQVSKVSCRLPDSPTPSYRGLVAWKEETHLESKI
jgi:hypothetical protein